jgi:hypothetical protein
MDETPTKDAAGKLQSSRSHGMWVVKGAMLVVAVGLVAGATVWIGRQICVSRSVDQAAEEAPQAPSAEEPDRNETNPGDGATSTLAAPLDMTGGVVVVQEGSGLVNLTPATAVVGGNVRERPLGRQSVLSGWQAAGDQAAWRFRLLRPGFFQLEIAYGVADSAGIPTVELVLDDAPFKTIELDPSGDDDQLFKMQTVAIAAAGEHVLRLRLASEAPDAALKIAAVRLIPVGADRATPTAITVDARWKGPSRCAVLAELSALLALFSALTKKRRHRRKPRNDKALCTANQS